MATLPVRLPALDGLRALLTLWTCASTSLLLTTALLPATGVHWLRLVGNHWFYHGVRGAGLQLDVLLLLAGLLLGRRLAASLAPGAGAAPRLLLARAVRLWPPLVVACAAALAFGDCSTLRPAAMLPKARPLRGPPAHNIHGAFRCCCSHTT